ncbi:MAG: hypothetical protein AB2556_25900, partial [Candidatus Thiodiazotropha sp.]
ETALGVNAVPPVVTVEVMTEEWALDPEVTVSGEIDVTPVVPAVSVEVTTEEGILDPVVDVAGVAVVMDDGRIVVLVVENGAVPGGRDVETALGDNAVPSVVAEEVITEELALDPEVTFEGETVVTPAVPAVSVLVTTDEGILDPVVDVAGYSVVIVVGRVEVRAVETGEVPGGNDVEIALAVRTVPPVVTVEVMSEEWPLEFEVIVAGEADVTPVVLVVSVVVTTLEGILDPVVDNAGVAVVMLVGRVVVVTVETGVVPGGRDVETALGVSVVPPVVTVEVMTEEWALVPEVTVAGEADVTPVVSIVSVVVTNVEGILDFVFDVAGVAVLMLVGRVEVRA